jgi:hypothetical protein
MPVAIVVTTTVTITAVIPITAVVIAIAAVAEGEDFRDSHILFLLCTGESLFPEGS